MTLSLRGRPRSLSTLIPGGAQPLTLPVRLPGGEQSFASYYPRAGGLGEIRVSLPRTTPPGTYEATVLLPEGEQPVVLEVQPQARLRFYPRRLAIAGSADERVTATLTALNEGNGSIDLPKTGGVGLYEETALECALGRAMRAERREGERLLDRILEEFAGEFGGTMRLSIETGAGPLGPDEARELALVLHLPDRLEPGKTYDGRWTFDGGSLPIQVRTGDKKGTAS